MHFIIYQLYFICKYLAIVSITYNNNTFICKFGILYLLYLNNNDISICKIGQYILGLKLAGSSLTDKLIFLKFHQSSINQ